MKNFFKENFVLVTGVALPVLLIIVLIILQALTAPAHPPAYSIVFATQNHYNERPFRFEVKDGKLKITYKELRNPQDHNWQTVIYVYDPAQDSLHETKLFEPDGLTKGQTADIDVPDHIASLKLNTHPKAPDGYTFGRRPYRSGSFFTEIFGYNRDNGIALIKDNHYVRLPLEEYRNNEIFIGWVVKE